MMAAAADLQTFSGTYTAAIAGCQNWMWTLMQWHTPNSHALYMLYTTAPLGGYCFPKVRTCALHAFYLAWVAAFCQLGSTGSLPFNFLDLSSWSTPIFSSPPFEKFKFFLKFHTANKAGGANWCEAFSLRENSSRASHFHPLLRRSRAPAICGLLCAARGRVEAE